MSPPGSCAIDATPPASQHPGARVVAALEDQLLALCGAGGGAAAAPDLLVADAPEQLAAPPEGALRAVYASHALARWAWRTWEFAVALILIRLRPAALGLVSAYGLLDNLVRVIAGGPVGRYVDSAPRLQGASAMVLSQNVCILASAAAAWLLLLIAGDSKDPQASVSPLVYWPLACVTIGLGASSSVGSMGASAAVEREWVKVLCGDSTMQLARVNAVMRAIDMLCLLLAPLVVGFLMTYSGMLPAVAVIWSYSALAWAPECLLLRVAHRLAPQLSEPRSAPAHKQAAPQASGLGAQHLLDGWRCYFRQPVLLPSLGLALIYLTVLSLGFLMTAYLRYHGMTEASLSVFRGAGAISGLLATIVFPRMQSAWGLEACGCVGISLLNATLLLGAAPTVIAALRGNTAAARGSGGATSGDADGQPASAALLWLLLSGLAASRFGVWLFDLAVSQLQQERTPADEQGTVAALQSSMQSLLEIASFVAGAAAGDPRRFHWLMLGSLAAVGGGGLLHASYMWRDGGGLCGWGRCARSARYVQLGTTTGDGEDRGAAHAGGGG